MNLDELYTEMIIQYSRETKHRKQMDNATATKRGVNPSCGDDITLQILIEDEIVKEIAYIGEGCAISHASTEMLAELIEGKTVEEAKELIETFLGMIKKDITEEEKLEKLGSAIVLQNISNMPARVKCAVLAWHTLKEALKNK